MFITFFLKVLSACVLVSIAAAQNSNIKYIGCFLGENALSLGDERRTFSSMSPQSCSTFCSGKRYPFFILQKDTCHCSKSYTAGHLVQYFEECNIKCTGDSSALCGGSPNYVSSYLTDSSNFQIEDQLLGCFVHSQGNTPYTMQFELIYTNTPSICSAICSNAAYLFGGVENLNCICSNSAPKNGQKLDISECDRSCVGDSSTTCGGEDRIQIYDVKRPVDVTIDRNTQQFIPTTTEPIRPQLPTIQSQPSYHAGENEFLNINSYWRHEIYIPKDPDYEFVYYDNSEKNSFIENGELVIKPTVISDSEFVRRGSLDLRGCTRNDNFGECSRTAGSYNILPPIMSAKLTTENSKLMFEFGKVEIVAKLPIGNWIVTELALVSKENYKTRLSLIAKGNSELKCSGKDEGTTALNLVYTLTNDRFYGNSTVYIYNPRGYTDGYHTFELSRSSDSIVVKVDGQIHNLDTSHFVGSGILNSQFYLSIGVSVGGIRNFPDGCLSNRQSKPWRNYNSKAMLNFWEDISRWAPTWNDEKSKLRIKSVKFTPFNNNQVRIQEQFSEENQGGFNRVIQTGNQGGDQGGVNRVIQMGNQGGGFQGGNQGGFNRVIQTGNQGGSQGGFNRVIQMGNQGGLQGGNLGGFNRVIQTGNQGGNQIKINRVLQGENQGEFEQGSVEPSVDFSEINYSVFQ